jgi:hypothetical protein
MAFSQGIFERKARYLPRHARSWFRVATPLEANVDSPERAGLTEEVSRLLHHRMLRRRGLLAQRGL